VPGHGSPVEFIIRVEDREIPCPEGRGDVYWSLSL
jgi:hypothetical protein